MQSRVAAYDYVCQVGAYQVVCTMLSRGQNMAFGATSCDVLPEGTRVLIYQEHLGDPTGWILGVINLASYLAMNNQNITVPAPMCYEFEDLSPYFDNPAYEPIERDKDGLRLWASDNRPNDVVPGETAIKNENNCGYGITSYDMTITGGNSFIRIGRIDDEIRMRSTNFTKWTAAQALREFNDAGLISAEGRDYLYQGELLGNEGLVGKKVEKPSETRGLEPRPRTRWWKGFLGNLFSWFAIRPAKKKGDADIGLASVHVSQAGNVMVRAAGGVSLERYDAIPVPKRLKPEWDPQGDRAKETEILPLKPFVSKDPHAAGLLKSSQMAWAQKIAYQRFDEFKKDFKTENEHQTVAPSDDDMDPFNSKELPLSSYRGRQAGVFVGDDGSVIIRDAWGSEIVMVGGNICINTSGNVITTANRNVVSVAGDGMELRGVKSADFSSDEGHTRIHSPKIVEIAGGTDTSDGGVLIESVSSSSMVNAKEEAGDEAQIGGVVIRSEKAGVSISGDKTYVTGKNNVYITTGTDGKTRTGNVVISGQTVTTTADGFAATLCEESVCYLSRSAAILGSNNGTAFVQGKSAMMFNGKQIPITWYPVDDVPDLSIFKGAWSALQDSSITKPYSWNELVEKAVFSFRKSVQAKTNTGIEPWRPNSDFCLYEPYWQVMQELGTSTVTATPVTPKPGKIHGSQPWPGKDAMASGRFVTATPLVLNVRSSSGNEILSKDRQALKDDGDSALNARGFTDFKV